MTIARPRLLALAVEAGAAAAIDPVAREWAREGGAACLAYALGGAVQHRRRRWKLPDGAEMGPELRDPRDVERLLDAYLPDAVLASATGSPFEVAARAWARANGIGMLQIVDTWANLTGRFSTDLPDRIGLIDEAAVRSARESGFAADRLVTVGQPAWEDLEPVADAEAGSLLFVGQPVEKAWGGKLGFTERDGFELCLAARGQAPELVRQLTYLVHPAEAGPPLFNEQFSVSRDPEAAVAQHAVVCGLFSSLSIEAHLRGRRVISLLPPGAGESLCHLARQRLVPVARTPDELVAALRSDWMKGAPHDMATAMTGSSARVLKTLHELATQGALS